MANELVSIVCGPIVRRTTSKSSVIWVETDADCMLHARARAWAGPPGTGRRAKRPPDSASKAALTVKVDGRYYALLELEDLRPGWLYKYALYYRPTEDKRPTVWTSDVDSGQWWEAELESYAMRGRRPAFRTFPVPKTEETRIAFASCRVLGGGFFGGKDVKGKDVFELYGQLLRSTAKDRLKAWPHLLLLLGDQIYADNVMTDVAAARLKDKKRAGKVVGNLSAPESILEWERDRIPGETKSLIKTKLMGRNIDFPVNIPDYAGWGEFQCMQYGDFAALYVAAWTQPDVAKMLANLPTFMMFDDHEIANDWNITGGWVAQMKKAPGWLDAVGEGLAAYWLYQGWGNPIPPLRSIDDRYNLLYKAALAGTDAMPKLRDWFINLIKAGRVVHYYQIDIFPPILVLDTRADRSFVAPKTNAGGIVAHADYDDEIISEEQWTWLKDAIDRDGPVVLASGVPFLQLPCADFWLMKTRSAVSRDFEDDSQEMSDIVEFFRRYVGTDQWTAFQKSFAKLTHLLFDKGPFIFLSGDVHYSYGMLGRADFPELCKFGKNPMMLHAVSSPLRSQWDAKELKTNNPEFCFSATGDASARSMKRNVELRIEQSQVCDLKTDEAELRFFLPDAAAVFDVDGVKKKWTHLNNIALLTVWKDGKSVKVSWLGASTKKGEILRELGALTSPLRTFVR